MTETVNTGAWASHRCSPDLRDFEFIAARLHRYPYAAIATMAGCSISYVRQAAAEMGHKPLHRQVKLWSPPKPPRALDRRSALPWRPSLPHRARQAVEAVADRNGVSYDDIIGANGNGPPALCEIRQEAYHAVRSIVRDDGTPQFSLPLIGSWFGGRDHTTILGGIAKHVARLRGGKR